MLRELTDSEMSHVSGGFSLSRPPRFDFRATRPVITINICDLIPDLGLCQNGFEGFVNGNTPTNTTPTITPPSPPTSPRPRSPNDPITPVQALPNIPTPPQTTQPDTQDIDLPDFNFSGLFGREGGRLTIFGFGRF